MSRGERHPVVETAEKLARSLAPRGLTLFIDADLFGAATVMLLREIADELHEVRVLLEAGPSLTRES